MTRRLFLQVEGGGPPVELPSSGVLSIGSGARAGLCVEGPGVAEVHCAIGRVKGGGWALKDLGSQNGTLVNERRVQQARLEPGDEIVVGTRRLLVVDRPRAFAPPEVAPVLAGYRIEKRLGRGGMGAVYLAVQESLNRRVALKVLSPRLSADLDFVRRFQDEARAAAALSHPNVVTVHDVWEEGGHHCLAMEYMERGNLEERVLREGRLDPGAVLAVLIDATRGLVFAELRGIVHRDIKPANLMQEGLGHTKLADLGLATHLEAEVAQSGDTRIFGTPHFISPEQARGEPVDGRSDLYSLGATAYRLLTGRTPFEGASTRDILRGHFTEPPRPLRALAPEVPPALEAVVLRLLQKDPAERFPSAAALLEELERQRAGLITAAGAGPGRGRRWLAWLAGLTAAAALVAAYFSAARRPAAPADPPYLAGQGADPTSGAGVEEAAPAAAATPAEDAPEALLDDDSALKALEREARGAYADLPSELLPEERAARLAELRRAYPGTTAAAEWGEELAALGTGARAAALDRARSSGAARTALEAIAQAGADQLRPLHALLGALRALPPPPAAAADPAFLAARAEALRAVLALRVAGAESALAEADRLAAAGRFEALDERLESLAAWLAPTPSEAAPPELAADEPTHGEPTHGEPGAQLPALAELERLADLRAGVLARRAALPVEREAWGIAREHADAGALAAAIAPGGALGEPLARLELAAVEAGLARLEAELGDTSSARFAQRLRADLARARTALTSLSQAFAAGAWRRRSITDPRAASSAALTVVGAGAEGLLVDGPGAPVPLAWGAFGADAAALDQLFRQRLDRDYTPEELSGIAALTRLAAVRGALNGAGGMLAGGPIAFGEQERGALLAGFEPARSWCHSEDDLRRLEAERAAADLLAASLAAAGRGAWSSAVASAERLLADHRDTCLVRLLSDARPWLAPPAADAAQAGEERPPATDPDLPEDPASERRPGDGRGDDPGNPPADDGRQQRPGRPEE